MSSIVVVFLLPVSFYQLGYFIMSETPPMHPYSWSFVHSEWNVIRKYPSLGLPVHWDRWMWISCGYIVFSCFGVGREARAMYRDWLFSIGLRQIFFSSENVGQATKMESKRASTWYNSVGSKARLVLTKSRPFTNSTMNDSL
jgi:pheromone a factor receptor